MRPVAQRARPAHTEAVEKFFGWVSRMPAHRPEEHRWERYGRGLKFDCANRVAQQRGGLEFDLACYGPKDEFLGGIEIRHTCPVSRTKWRYCRVFGYTIYEVDASWVITQPKSIPYEFEFIGHSHALVAGMRGRCHLHEDVIKRKELDHQLHPTYKTALDVFKQLSIPGKTTDQLWTTLSELLEQPLSVVRKKDLYKHTTRLPRGVAEDFYRLAKGRRLVPAELSRDLILAWIDEQKGLKRQKPPDQIPPPILPQFPGIPAGPAHLLNIEDEASP